jgi:membrane protein implicated in regulation of membrane protease activity
LAKPLKSLRLSRILFCIVMCFIGFFLIWPGYTLFSSATPLIFGFPLSFAWIIFCTIAGFIALLALYFSDKKADGGRD